MKSTDKHEGERYEMAKKRVEELRAFYSHLFVYLAVNAGLLLGASSAFVSVVSIVGPPFLPHRRLLVMSQ